MRALLPVQRSLRASSFCQSWRILRQALQFSAVAAFRGGFTIRNLAVVVNLLQSAQHGGW